MSRLGKETGIKSQHWHLVSFCPFWPGGGLKPERSEGTATAKPGPQAPGPGAPGERGAQTRPHGPGPPLGGQGPRPQASGSERPGRGRARRRTSRAAGPERPGGPQGRPRRGAKKRASKPKNRQERSATTLRGATANGASEWGPKAPRGNDVQEPFRLLWPLTLLPT